MTTFDAIFKYRLAMIIDHAPVKGLHVDMVSPSACTETQLEHMRIIIAARNAAACVVIDVTRRSDNTCVRVMVYIDPRLPFALAYLVWDRTCWVSPGGHALDIVKLLDKEDACIN